jgi:phosphoribosylformimino-5-aminoimidazole carboxamide ribotide isomerase
LRPHESENSVIIYPSIDIRGGKVVRLREGDPNRQITFSDDPVATAQQWIANGAVWLHMVNLDGAFAKANDNRSILERVAQLGIPVQFGGGLRSFDDVSRALDNGATRIILGTAAVEQPELVVQALERWDAERIGVALDARDGKVATRGWQHITALTPIELGKQMAAYGVQHALYTDVNRDGGLSGVNLESTISLGRETGLQVIASGGVTTTDEIRQLARSGVVAGAVIGMALYEGRLRLQQALKAAEG